MNVTAWGLLHAHLHQTLRSRIAYSVKGTPQTLLPKASRVLVAVSGGQDSQCLLQLLVALRDKWNWQLRSVHCNHCWRTDADANADFVAALSEQWGVPCIVQTANQPPISEAAARHWRYQVFASVARAQECTHVATGHTASDRAETLLYNLVRGSGAEGLQALTWHRSLAENTRDISLVRPLLDITRAQTAQFCRDYAIPIWEDSTNEDRTYARNRLRLDVLPLLRDQFNPQVDSTLAQTAEILAAEVVYLEKSAQALFEQCVERHTIQRRRLREAPLALQRRVLRQALCQWLPVHPQFEHIEKLVSLLRAPNRSQTDPFPGGAIAYVDDPWVKFSGTEC
ncbi:MAG: tRNA lysidine(34) synthetase TilS [Leptolyngbya sp. SIO1D8]|nr:tRNA lysidine(34) synthetase TilS [Leptolyngbya sp. SIO1D8]